RTATGAIQPGGQQGAGRGGGYGESQSENRGDGGAERLHALQDQRPRSAAAPGRPEEESDPVSGRQSAVRRADDAARHPGQPVRSLAGADLRERTRQNLCGIRQALLALRTIRQRESNRSRRHARSQVGAAGSQGDSVTRPTPPARPSAPEEHSLERSEEMGTVPTPSAARAG